MEFELYKVDNQYRWRLQAGNNKIIADSGEAYHNKSDCMSAINLVKTAAQATVKDLTQSAAAISHP